MALRPAPRWAVASLILAVVVGWLGWWPSAPGNSPAVRSDRRHSSCAADPTEVVTWVFVACRRRRRPPPLPGAHRRPAVGRPVTPAAGRSPDRHYGGSARDGGTDHLRADRSHQGSALRHRPDRLGGGQSRRWSRAAPRTAGPTGSLWWVAVLIAVVALAALAVAACRGEPRSNRRGMGPPTRWSGMQPKKR